MNVLTFLEKVCNLLSETLARTHFCLAHPFLDAFDERPRGDIIVNGFR